MNKKILEGFIPKNTVFYQPDICYIGNLYNKAIKFTIEEIADEKQERLNKIYNRFKEVLEKENEDGNDCLEDF